MTFPFNFCSSKAPPSRTYVCRETVTTREHSAALALAGTYRTGRPNKESIDRLKFHLGWDELDNHGRYRAQQWLCNLVENVGGPAISYLYPEAIAADFPVDAQTTELHRLSEKNATAAPQLQRQLDEQKTQLQDLEERHRLLHEHLKEVEGDRDALVDDNERLRKYTKFCEERWSTFALDDQASRNNRNSLRERRISASKRLSMPPPIGYASIEQLTREIEAGPSH